MRIARGPAALAVAAVLGCAGAVAITPSGQARAQQLEPKITISPASAAPGDLVYVWLDGWPLGAVTVQVCGNDARRGSQDCDNVGARSVPVRGSTTVQFRFALTTPPVGCPCVVRATTSVSDQVQAAPIDLIGVPGGVHLEPAGGLASASVLEVRAKVVEEPLDWPKSWYRFFGGDANDMLVLTLTNNGAVPVAGLRVTGQVGRKANSGEPIAQEIEGAIEPGERRKVAIPFDISAPAWGDYVVSGSIYGLAQPLAFKTSTTNDPWGLEVAAVAFVLLLALLARRREKRERLARDPKPAPLAPRMKIPATVSTPVVVATPPARSPVLDRVPAFTTGPPLQSSPDVGDSYDERCEAPSYDQQRHDPSPADGADGAHLRTHPALSPSVPR